ncbi:MAG: TIGR03960 family B12-binding radical SAM protein [Planctomycetia bacterium]|nr:MAG: TIGR03960 family B12-binding radical SAM protein [Planctomycetia bacterium]RIK70236.1 MAG: TIGR03960 family B12-binding radical SAM protein [Planctomycetota bacterium]
MLDRRISDELLPYVKQPSQYIGREFNQLVRDGDWDAAQVRVVVGFPDAYTIGMSHLGCQILYWLCNHTPGVCAERVYCPWTDAEQLMRDKRIPLFTWDTRRPVSEADLFAISLQYELGFTGFLQLLDLAGIPLRAAERDDRHPLVIVGGPQADNPEPVADFVDLVVVGDGEGAMAAILELYKELKSSGVRRRDMIEIMARRFPWAYAPSLYDVSYHADGTIAGVIPRIAGLPAQIERCQTPDFENAPFPTRPLVPYAEVVHDRMAVEVMRGCPQRCRFCHAGYTKRPVGVRSVEKILSILEEQYAATGHEEIGLLSLSTADYPHLRELSARVNERFAGRHVNISMPSLRVDKMLQNIPWMASSVRKGGLTIAVEAARDTLRAAIRKKVTDGNLMDGLVEAYKAGWNRIKTYFMVGFPGETPDDIRGIYELSREMSAARKRIGKPPAFINASVGWLVPKPYTPFQWAAQPRIEYFQEARRILAAAVHAGRTKAVRISTHDAKRSILEAVLSRGDRRLCAAVERAYRLGARFDGWDEAFDYGIWLRAFEATGVDPDWYAHRERATDEILPWDHIRSGPKRDYLQDQYSDVFIKTAQPAPAPGVLPLPILA